MKEEAFVLLWIAKSLIVYTVNATCIASVHNAALNRPAYQSSVLISGHLNFVAKLANDGNRETTIHKNNTAFCSFSNNETNPWWAVDLGRPMTVCRVDFTNRLGHNAYRSNNFIIGLTNVTPVISKPTLWNYTLCGQYPGTVASAQTVSMYCQDNLPPARFLIVQFPVTDYMNFCELEVYTTVKNETAATDEETGSSSLLVPLISVSVIAAVLIMVAAIQLILLIKQRADMKQLRSRGSADPGRNYGDISAPDTNHAYQELANVTSLT